MILLSMGFRIMLTYLRLRRLLVRSLLLNNLYNLKLEKVLFRGYYSGNHMNY